MKEFLPDLIHHQAWADAAPPGLRLVDSLTVDAHVFLQEFRSYL